MKRRLAQYLIITYACLTGVGVGEDIYETRNVLQGVSVGLVYTIGASVVLLWALNTLWERKP